METQIMRARQKSIWGMMAISLFLLVFINYKAATTSFTHDESFTTLHFFPQPEMDILFYRHHFTSVITNNHILNTFLMKLSESIFGLSEWALRLPNILALVCYLYFGYLLSTRLTPPKMRFLSFLLLLANPYLIDFFGLARGYGLSIGTMLGSFYFLQSYLESKKASHLLWFHTMSVLSVMSNFALLNFYVASLGCLYLLPLLKREAWSSSSLSNWKFHSGNMIAAAILSALLYAPFKVILANNTVSFGGKNGFFSDTAVSLIRRSLYGFEFPEGWVVGIAGMICFLVLLPAGLIVVKLFKGQADFFTNHTSLVISNILCWLIALMTLVQHHLFGQDFLVGRFAIFLYPLFALNLIFFTEWIWCQARGKVLAYGILWLSTGLLIANTLFNMNTTFYQNWKYDKDTKKAMQWLKDNPPPDAASVSRKIGVFHKLEPTMNLYRRWWELHWIQKIDRQSPEAGADYWYIQESELERLGIASTSEVLFRSEGNDLILLKKR